MFLTADPRACTVPATTGKSTHKQANSEAEKIVFEVKSSNNNNEYRIKPVLGFVEPGASIASQVTCPPEFLRKKSKEDIQLVPAPTGAADATAAFQVIVAAAPAGTITLGQS